MSRRASIVAVSVIIGVTVASPVARGQATIKKANGEIVRGEIQGTLVQKDVQRTSAGGGGYGALYLKVSGKDVVAIDENGVKWGDRSSVERLIIVQKDPVNDLEVLDASTDFFGRLISYRVKTGASIDQTTGRIEPNPNPAALLGEFRSGGGTPQIVPAVSVKVGQAVVSITLGEIVKFKTPVSK